MLNRDYVDNKIEKVNSEKKKNMLKALKEYDRCLTKRSGEIRRMTDEIVSNSKVKDIDLFTDAYNDLKKNLDNLQKIIEGIRNE